MSPYAHSIDVTASTELERLAERVQTTGQPIPLMRRGEIVAIVQPAPLRQRARRRPRVSASASRYPTLESIVGAAGSLPEPRPWKEVLAEAREDHLAKKFPPQHG
jgi:hypothetical protein